MVGVKRFLSVLGSLKFNVIAQEYFLQIGLFT